MFEHEDMHKLRLELLASEVETGRNVRFNAAEIVESSEDNTEIGEKSRIVSALHSELYINASFGNRLKP